jgi:hypothetical protein
MIGNATAIQGNDINERLSKLDNDALKKLKNKAWDVLNKFDKKASNRAYLIHILSLAITDGVIKNHEDILGGVV